MPNETTSYLSYINKDTDISRRRLLKLSVSSAALLSTSSLLVSLAGCGRNESRKLAQGSRFLTERDSQLITALIPVILAAALPHPPRHDHAIQDIVTAFDVTVSHFSPAIRQEIRQLLDLLTLPITRIVLARVSKPWQQATTADISTFLRNWRQSRFGLLRAGYDALHDLIAGAWYANPESWKRVGYPGPPRLT